MTYPAAIRTCLFLLGLASGASVAHAGVDLLRWEACQKADQELQTADEDRLPGFFEDDCSMEPSSITPDQFLSTAFTAEKCLWHSSKEPGALVDHPECNRVKPVPDQLLKIPIGLSILR